MSELAVVSRSRTGISWSSALYLIAGGSWRRPIDYWTALHTFKAVFSAVLATLLWPLVLLGINFQIH